MRHSNPSDDELREIYRVTGTIAAVGASRDPAKPAHRIPAYLAGQGFKVVAVNPRGGELFGQPVRASLSDIHEGIDVVEVFRPADEAPDIAHSAVAVGAKVLWLQDGIRSEEAGEIARAAGMTVVMDTCMGSTHARLALGG